MFNPWKKEETGSHIVTATGEPVVGNFRAPGQGSSLTNSAGEINASSVRDLLGQIDQVMKAHASGAIQKQRISRDEVEQRRNVLTAAYNDPTGNKWRLLGAAMAEEIRGQADREGFMRRVLQLIPVEQGGIPRTSLRIQNAMAVVATSPSVVEYQQLRSNNISPPEFHLVASLMVDNIDIQQTVGDVLERTYNEGLEAIMTGEDRLLKKAMDNTIGVENPVIYIGSSLTPSILAQVRSGVTNHNLPSTTILLANNLWQDIIGNSDFHSLFDPVHRYDLVTSGAIGSMLGAQIITDAFKTPTQKVLNQGELYALASPEYLGAYSDRGGVVPTPIDGANIGTTGRGWFLQQLMSLVVANPRGVSVGRRV